jgi:hypothetical protein
MPVAQLAHQVLGWLAVLAAVAVLVLAGVAELQEPAAVVPVPAAQAPTAGVVAAQRQRATEVTRHEDALRRVEFASFTAAGVALIMLLVALAGGAPAPFRSVSVALLGLAVVQILLFELKGAAVGLGALHLVVAAVLLGAAVRAAARHILLPAPWTAHVPRQTAVPA